MSELTISNAHIWAVVPAAGLGTRMGTQVKKQFLKLKDGVEIFIHTLRTLNNCPAIEGIVLVCSRDDLDHVREILDGYSLSKVQKIIPGGATRQLSVYEGLKVLPRECQYVAVHDAVRPFLTPEDLMTVLADGLKYEASLLSVPVKDTIKKINPDGFAAETLDRQYLWSTQTPQVFKAELLKSAHDKAFALGDLLCTDDGQVVEKYTSTPVHLCKGSYNNIKITTPEDLV